MDAAGKCSRTIRFWSSLSFDGKATVYVTYRSPLCLCGRSPPSFNAPCKGVAKQRYSTIAKVEALQGAEGGTIDSKPCRFQ